MVTLTANEQTIVANLHTFSFFDEGMVEGANTWGDELASDIANLLGCNLHAAAALIGSLSTKGIWDISGKGDDSATSLTAFGARLARV